MSKANRAPIPTRFLPPGSRRVTNTAGDRVWLIRGKEYASKREYFQYLEDLKLAEKAKPPVAPDVKTDEGGLDSGDPAGI